MLFDDTAAFWIFAAIWVIAILLADLRGGTLHAEFMRWSYKEQLPAIIGDSILVGSEVELEGTLGAGKLEVCGRADQIMRTNDDQYFPVDTKLRRSHRVSEDDRIQLSIYDQLMNEGQYQLHATLGSSGQLFITMVARQSNITRLNYSELIS